MIFVIFAEKYLRADINLETETINDTGWNDIYRTAGIIQQSPGMVQWASGNRTRKDIGKKLLAELRNT